MPAAVLGVFRRKIPASVAGFSEDHKIVNRGILVKIKLPVSPTLAKVL